MDEDKPKLRMEQLAYLDLVQQVKEYSNQFFSKSTAYNPNNDESIQSNLSIEILEQSKAGARIGKLPIGKEMIPLLQASGHPITTAAAEYIQELLNIVKLHEQVIFDLKSERATQELRHQRKVTHLELDLKMAKSNNFIRNHSK